MDNRNIGDADHALDRNQQFGLLRGNGHIEGGPAELDAEAEPPTVTAPTPWSVYVDGETVDIDGDENTVELPQPHPTLDRWDVIYIDPDGELQVESGEPAQVIGERGLQARQPAPPSFAEIDGVVIAAAYRQFDEADDPAFGLSELFYDRRVRTLADVESLVVKNADAENLAVSNAPEADTDAVRKLEADELQENIDTLNTAFEDHSERHQNNGEDELNVEGLSGDLADRQDPKDHQERHHEGGPDEIAEGSLTRQDPTNHGERHHEGEVDEIAADQLVLDGSPNQFLSGVGWSQVPDGAEIEVFETSGTWEKPDGIVGVFVDIVGAGGGGGGDEGGGGGGGARILNSFASENLPNTVDVVIGSGGAAGDADNNGEQGGDSSFGDLLCGGGDGGISGFNEDGGAGGSVVNEDIGTPYGGGEAGLDDGDNTGGSSVYGGGGGGRATDAGGDSVFACGGGAGRGSDPGGTALSYGAGDGGDSTETGEFPGGGGGGDGGNGADGVVRVITW